LYFGAFLTIEFSVCAKKKEKKEKKEWFVGHPHHTFVGNERGVGVEDSVKLIF
jgi:hypothetical protein